MWVPNPETVGADFAPYVTAGHWALTDDDQWVWVSDYEWGSGPFHYGRWVWIDGTGWAWIPGGVYAPAWVVWQTGYYDEAYVGWAPMPPAWCWRGGVAVRGFRLTNAANLLARNQEPRAGVARRHEIHRCVNDSPRQVAAEGGTRLWQWRADRRRRPLEFPPTQCPPNG